MTLMSLSENEFNFLCNYEGILQIYVVALFDASTWLKKMH